MSIKIITDTGADIPAEYIEKYEIDMLSIPVNDGEREFTKEELSSKELFKSIKENKVFGTSQVSAYEYERVFTKYASEQRELIYISLSSGLSSTYKSAIVEKNKVLEKYKSAKIHIVDSLSATTGQGLIVIRAAIMAKDNKSSEEILKALNFYSKNQEHIFSVTTLEYLLRGGRISKAQAAIGGLLNIKPVLKIEKEEGKLVAFEKARGEKNLFKKFIAELNKLEENVIKEQTIAIIYGEDIELAKSLKENLICEYGIKEKNIILQEIGIVIGSHTGPGFITVSYLGKTYNKDYDII